MEEGKRAGDEGKETEKVREREIFKESYPLKNIQFRRIQVQFNDENDAIHNLKIPFYSCFKILAQKRDCSTFFTDFFKLAKSLLAGRLGRSVEVRLGYKVLGKNQTFLKISKAKRLIRN